MTEHDSKGLIGRVAGRVTGRVVETIDPDLILEYVDIDALLDRIDINRVLDRVDLQRVLDRVDMNAILEDVDLEELVRRSGVPDIVASSTSHMAASMLDQVRRQLAGLDAIADRMLLRRPARHGPTPPLLAQPHEVDPSATGSVTGHYAGAVSRAAAAAIDAGLIALTFTVGIAAVDLIAKTFFGKSITTGESTPLAVIGLAAWAFLYMAVGLAVAGRTIGKGLIGLRVVRADGSTLGPGRAVVRTVCFPLSALLLIGFIMIPLNRRHRALHDVLGGTAVVYDWGDRAADLPTPVSAFLAKQAAA